MPFVKKTETENGILGIWRLTESAEALQADFVFSANENEEFTKIKFEKRKVEYLATRLLLQHLLNEKTEIIYLEHGKPVLKNLPLKISVSHSANFVTVIVSEKNVGIDVEQTNRNVDKVANRFLSKQELTDVQNCSDPQTAKIIYWGAKESIFKCTGFHGIQFNSQILISPFQTNNEGFFTGKLIAGNQVELYNLWYFTFENNMVVYCVENKNR